MVDAYVWAMRRSSLLAVLVTYLITDGECADGFSAVSYVRSIETSRLHPRQVSSSETLTRNNEAAQGQGRTLDAKTRPQGSKGIKLDDSRRSEESRQLQDGYDKRRSSMAIGERALHHIS